MGFLAPAVPWIIKGGSLLGGWLAGRKAQSSAQQRSPEELQALTSATSAGNSLLQQGQQFQKLGLPAVQSGMGYWDTLLRGSRSAMAGATAGPRGAITDQYRGATQNLEHSGIRGAARDQATAELNRDRVGKIAGLTSGVQPGAAQQLSGLGSGLIEQGGSQMNAAGGLFSGLLGQGAANRQYARSEGEKAGTGIGSFLFDILSSDFKKKPPMGLPTGQTPYPNSNGGIWG
jgi:hypothetical protein